VIAGAIDIHTHILPPELPRYREKYGYGGFIELHHLHGCKRARMLRDDGKFFREIDSRCWDGADRLTDCDSWDVGTQVLSTVPVMFSYWAGPDDALDLARGLNDHLAGVVAARPDRFIGLATVPLQKPELAIRELERSVKELGLAGVQIGSHVNAWNLDAPELFAFFEAAQDLGASLFIHPWDMIGQERMPKYWLPWLVGMPMEVSLAICSMIMGGVFSRLPRLRVAFAHGGGAFPGTLGRVQHGFESRPDLCAVDSPLSPRAALGRFWVDSLVHDEETLRFIVKLFGEDRVALGSDYPFPLGEAKPGELISRSDFPKHVKQKLRRENALGWLGRES
jgi:aminocarboxymuconate-semialdehyde decarboxylase